MNNGHLLTTARLSPARLILRTILIEKTPKTATSVQQPFFWGPKGGRCRQVWLYYKIYFLVELSRFPTALDLYPIYKEEMTYNMKFYLKKRNLIKYKHDIKKICFFILLFLNLKKRIKLPLLPWSWDVFFVYFNTKVSYCLKWTTVCISIFKSNCNFPYLGIN